MYSKEVVILANSIKHSSHCVAGKEYNSKGWVRSVANESGGELSREQVKYCNVYGAQGAVKPLQRIKMTFSNHVPLIHQPENYLIDGSMWRQNYTIATAELDIFIDSPSNLWGTGGCVPYLSIARRHVLVSQSLYLVRVSELRLYITENNKRRARFRYNSIPYDLPVTDPNFDLIYQDGQATNNILCISLGENFNGNCYKIVATIF